MDEVFAIMPVHSKISTYTFIFSLSTLQHDSRGQYSVLKIWLEFDHEHGKKFISPILLLAVVVVLQFESQYLKNHKKYRSETLQIGRV